jgi:hypothetical protein
LERPRKTFGAAHFWHILHSMKQKTQVNINEGEVRDSDLGSIFDRECGFCFPISIEGVSQNRRGFLHLDVSTLSGALTGSERAQPALIPPLAVWEPCP